MFHENLKRIRKERNLSQKEVAEFLNISTQSISKWENGDALPSTEFLPRLSALLGCSIDDFFTEEKIVINSETETIKRYLAAERDLTQDKINHKQWDEILETIPYYYEHTLKFLLWLEKRKSVTKEQLLTYLRCSSDDLKQIINDLIVCEIIMPLDIENINIDDVFLIYSAKGARVLLTTHYEFVHLKNKLSAKELADIINSQK